MIKIRPARPFHPALELLDQRRLLSGLLLMHPAVYPMGTVGPLPSGSRYAAAGEVLPQPTYSAPKGWVSGTGMNNVVGSMIAGVDSNGQGSIISHVNYSVTGALGASNNASVPGQIWDTSAGKFNRTSGIDHDFANNPQPTDSWNWLWDETAGQRSIEVTVTFKDGEEWVGTYSVQVSAVYGAFFQVQIAQASMGYYPDTGEWGLFNGGGSSYGGVAYLSNMFAANGARGGLIQLVNMQASIKGFKKDATGKYTVPFTTTVAFPAGVYALDQPLANATPYYMNNYSVSLNPTGAPPPEVIKVSDVNTWYTWNVTGKYPWDEPGISVPSPGDPQIYTSISYKYSFKTYQDWGSPGGGHVEVAEADWSVQASATYTKSVNPAPSQSNYWYAPYWNVTPGPVTGPTYSSGDQLPVWPINVQDAQDLYTTTT